jgi:thymidine kinase
MSKNPEFIIFTGPMFGSKTTRMLAAIDRYRYQNKLVAAFKPQIDKRYAISSISTHSGGALPAICIETGEDIIKNVHKTTEVVAVDEAFMIPDISKTLIDLFQRGHTIVVSSLQLSAAGNTFDEMRDMMPWATKIEVCPAVCPICGSDAYYTQHKVEELDEIAIGGAELYVPRCWTHYNNKGEQ